MEEGIGRNEQFQELKKKLAKEYNRLRNETKIDHVSFFRHPHDNGTIWSEFNLSFGMLVK